MTMLGAGHGSPDSPAHLRGAALCEGTTAAPWFPRGRPWLVLVAPPVSPSGVTAQEPPTLGAADYGRWERLGSFRLDPTGRWLVTEVTRVDETRELRLHRADGTGEPLVLEHAAEPQFAPDGRWMAYRKGSHPD